MTPAEREARWRLEVRFAIEADSAAQAGAVLAEALGGLDCQLPLQGEPVIRPRHYRHPDDIWIADITPHLTQVTEIEPDNAAARCGTLMGHFPPVMWTGPAPTEREAMYEWPPDIWSRLPQDEVVMLHQAVRAVRIHCAAVAKDT